jgi:hypothetical protein
MPNLPVVGQIGKGPAIAIGVGGLGVAGLLIYRHNKKKKQQSAAVASAEAASAAAAAAYGYGFNYGYNNPYYGYGEPGAVSNVGGYFAYGTPLSPYTLPAASTTNAQWVQAAITQLTQDGYNAQDIVAALGAYEQGQPLTPLQQQIVQAAIAVEGNPPQAVPPIQVQATPGGGTGGGQTSTDGGTPSTTSVHVVSPWTGPNLRGKTIAQAQALVAGSGYTIINNNNLGPNQTITSFTPYSNGQIRTG